MSNYLRSFKAWLLTSQPGDVAHLHRMQLKGHPYSTVFGLCAGLYFLHHATRGKTWPEQTKLDKETCLATTAVLLNFISAALTVNAFVFPCVRTPFWVLPLSWAASEITYLFALKPADLDTAMLLDIEPQDKFHVRLYKHALNLPCAYPVRYLVGGTQSHGGEF